MVYKPKRLSLTKKKFYVTTPIYYINFTPSVGSAYPTIIADVLARWHKLKGEDVFFLTGLDENSVKTVQSAKTAGFSDIQKYADDMASKWKAAWKRLDINYDNFIRTTDEEHKKIVQDFFLKLKKSGDVYKGSYNGLYCEGCEAFYLEKDLVDGKCPYHKTVPKKISEENYFFKLEKYQKWLLEYIEANPDFIKPITRRNEVISFIKDGLKDVSITRPNQVWGITIPGDENQRAWVWIDALNNYISGSKGNWPASLHIVGKDIIRFHCILWPAFLKSAGYPLPKTIFAHGFFTVNGQKMSKSLGNVVDPVYLADTYGVDTLRYYLLREIPFGEDGDFSESNLVERHNNELANELGNLVHRTLAIAEQKCGLIIPTAPKSLDGCLVDQRLSKPYETVFSLNIENYMNTLRIDKAIQEIFFFISSCNKFINAQEPWKKEGKELDNILYSLLESIRVIAVLLYPFMPTTSEKIFKQLNWDVDLKKLNLSNHTKFGLLKAGTKLGQREILFKKIETRKK